MDLNETLKELGIEFADDGETFGLAELDVAHGFLTVGKLMEICGALDPNTQVTIDDTNGWYTNVGTIGLPTTTDGYSTLTLIPGEGFDPRQL